MKGFLKAAAAALFLIPMAAAPASAVTWIFESPGYWGQLIEAKGIMVGTETYDVSFNGRDTCAVAFNGCDDASDFVFHTHEEASAASQALLDQVFLDDPLSPKMLDSEPKLTDGCAYLNVCEVHTPYAPGNGGWGLSSCAWNGYNDSINNYCMPTDWPWYVDPELGTGCDCFDWFTWAVWTPSLTPVPLPAALPLLGAGLLPLGLIGRRRKNKAA